MTRATPFLVGLLFGLGLCLSGMTDPPKVLGFLDLAGAWDPSLAFVMGGAVVVAFFAFRIALGRGKTLSGQPLDLPASRAIDGRLISGLLLFGVGWGLVGLCPGPAIADIGFSRRPRGAGRARDGRRDGDFLRCAFDPGARARECSARGWLSAPECGSGANCAIAPFSPRRCAARRHPSAPARAAAHGTPHHRPAPLRPKSD